MKNSTNLYIKMLHEYFGKDESFVYSILKKVPGINKLIKKQDRSINSTIECTKKLQDFLTITYSLKDIRIINRDIDSVLSDLKTFPIMGIILSFFGMLFLLVMNSMKEIIMRLMDQASIITVKTELLMSNETSKVEEISTVKQTIYKYMGFTFEEIVFYLTIFLAFILIFKIITTTYYHLQNQNNLQMLKNIIELLIEEKESIKLECDEAIPESLKKNVENEDKD
jgi:chaperonin cofactor prefoldin